jgi:hypothetical protein
MAELATRYDLGVLRNDLDVVRRELETKIDAVRREMEAKIDTLSMRLTIRMGVMVAAGVAALAAIIKLWSLPPGSAGNPIRPMMGSASGPEDESDARPQGVASVVDSTAR